MIKIKYVILVLVLAIFMCCIVLAIVLAPLFGGFYPMTYRKASKFYNNNSNNLLYIINAVISSEYESLELKDINKDIATYAIYDDVSGNRYVEVDILSVFDEEFKRCLDELYENGVLNISKSKNICMITLWSSLDAGKGLLYSQDSIEDIRGIIYTEEIVPGWLYYEECIDLWLERKGLR